MSLYIAQLAAPQGEDQRWMWAVIPFNMALGPLGTFIPIYILKLGGNAITVGLAVTLYNGMAIPASIIWGLAVDATGWRRKLVLMSYGVTTAMLFLLFFARDAYSVALTYAAIGIFSAASSTPISLLVMETAPKEKWASAFSALNLMASAGVTAGLLFATLYTSVFSMREMMIVLGVFGLSSTATAVLLIKDPPLPLERRSLSMHPAALSSRLLSTPLFFLRIPRLRHFYRFAKERWRTGNPTFPLYLSLFLFYVASGLFNTMISPGLYTKGLTESEVFAVIMAGYVVQTLSFHISGKFIEKRGEKVSARTALYLRALGYSGIAFFVIFLGAIETLGASLVFYPLAAGFAYAVFYASSNVMIFKTLGAHAGTNLGIYSSLVSVATLLGSFVSGYTSFYLGYGFTYLLAAGFLVACAETLKWVKL